MTDKPHRDLLLGLLAPALLLVAGAGRMYVGVCGQCHDDAIYVVTARALAEGNGYRLINLPGEPPQTKYPILYPALLAAVWKIWPQFPDNLLALQGITLLLGCVALFLFHQLVVRFGYASRSTAVAAGLLCATSASFVFFNTLTLSEPLFAVLLLGSLWWLESVLRAPPGEGPLASRLGGLLGGIVLALPFLCRSIGALFIPLALLLLWQSGRPWRWVAAGVALSCLPWIGWTLQATLDQTRDPVRGYYTDYAGWWLSFGLPSLGRVIDHNLRWILLSVGTMPLDGLSNLWLDSGADRRLWLLAFTLLGMVSLGSLVLDVRQSRPLATCLLAYLLLVCIWPWAPHRFLFPILPLLLVYAARGLSSLARLAKVEKAASLAGWAGVTVAGVVGGMQCFQYVQARHLDKAINPEMRCESARWPRHQRLFAWVRDNSRPGDVLAAGADPMLALYTGRKAFYPIVCFPQELWYGLPVTGRPSLEETLQGMERQGTRFLVLTPQFHGEEAFRKWVKEIRQRFPGRFVTRYQDAEDPRYEVIEVLHDAGK